MSEDKMQDVFPVVFDFEKGEQSTAQKLTGFIRHTDSAFSRLTRGIGDPWDYTRHTGSGGAYSLSLKNLSQASLARAIGSSDWVSPAGGCWNEITTAASTIEVVLAADRNQWILGYPLVTVSSDLDETSQISGKIAKLAWFPKVTVTGDTDNVLLNRRTSPEAVVADGDFYVDYYKGVITAYEISSVAITLEIDDINMFGPGVPWATQNVIPNWEESTLCTVAHVSDTATTSTYTITFPTVAAQTRTTNLSTYGQRTAESADDDDSTWSHVGGYSSNYRIPAALTGASLSAGDIIPEGFCQLWDGTEAAGRVVPQIIFKYRNTYSFTLVTPYMAGGWLTIGSSAYRVITTGSSAAENINYLMQMTRNNEHVGLTDNPSIGYTLPLSHDNLEDRYTSEIDNSLADVSRYMFTESNYPTNSHPQYLHRGGYMASDTNGTFANGNTGNAMRGDLVMAGDADGSGTSGFKIADGIAVRYSCSTVALSFGGGETDGLSETQNACMRLEGHYTDSSWVAAGTPRAVRIGFALTDTGAANTEYYNTISDVVLVGGLSLYPGGTGPLFLRGHYDETTPATTEVKNGAVLGFDLGQRNEPNYIRMQEGTRTIGQYDITNLPAKMSQGDSALAITPALTANAPGTTKRLAPEQMREFRFRGVPWVDGASNTDDGIGGTNTRNPNPAIEEFQEYFTSPGIIGADFINVYSNAIFFSDTGDGKATSFTTEGKDWLENTGTFNAHTPSGIYFKPWTVADGTNDGEFVFSVNENGTGTQPLKFGYSTGLYLHTENDVFFEIDSGAFAVILNGTGNITLDCSTGGDMDLDGDNVTIDATGDIAIDAIGNVEIDGALVSIDGTGLMNFTTSGGNMSIEATLGDVTVTASGVIDLNCANIKADHIPTGITGAAAGVAIGELWVTNAHGSLPDGVVARRLV